MNHVQNLYSVFDVKAEIYSPVFHAQNDEVAKRMFDSSCNDMKTDFSRHPEDYTLWVVGVFDGESAEIGNFTNKQIARAMDFVGKSNGV